jgi:hypothetical protein
MAKAGKKQDKPEPPLTPEEVSAYVKGHVTEALDALGIDAVCDRIADGATLTAIAAEIEVSKGSLLAWLAADPDRSARAREARSLSARGWDEQAEAEIRRATDAFELAKARELAQHYRWRAAKIAPRDYGDKVQLADADGNKLPPAPQFIIGPVLPLPKPESAAE